MSDAKRPSVIQEPTMQDALMLLIAYVKEEERKEDERRGMWRDLHPEKFS